MTSVTSVTLAAVFGCLLVQHADAQPRVYAGQALNNVAAIRRTDLLADEPSVCGDWLGPNNNFCYKLSDAAISWTAANQYGCEELHTGAHLASVTYGNKAFLSKQRDIINSDYFWVGLRSGDNEWNKGTSAAETVDYTNWAKLVHTEPSGSSVNNDDCVLVVGETAPDQYKPAGSWMDWSCDDGCSFLCELKQEEPDVECPDDWTKHSGICYKLHHQLMGFDDANVYCAEQQPGATLAAVPDYSDLAKSVTMDADYIWIALRSTPDDQGRLHWLNVAGGQVTQTNWKAIEYEEPNGSQSGVGDCVFVNGLDSGETMTVWEWGDYDCSYESRFLCAVHVVSKS